MSVYVQSNMYVYVYIYGIYVYTYDRGEGIIILASELAFFRVFSLWEISQTNGVNVKF